MNSTRQRVINAAITLCDNATYLPDGMAQVPEEICEELGQSLSNLNREEEEKYGQALGEAEVALLRVNMPEEQLAVEQALDMADRLYGALFDRVIAPGQAYLISKSECEGVRYLTSVAIANFRESLQDVT